MRKPRFYQQSSAMLIMLAVMEDPQDVKMEVGWTTSWPSKIQKRNDSEKGKFILEGSKIQRKMIEAAD